MMDESAFSTKYWGMGNTLFVDDDEFVFSSPQDMRKAIEAIEILDVLEGGVKHERI